MPATATVAAPAQPVNAPAKSTPAIPFPIAARRKYSLGPTTTSQALSTTGAQVNLGPIQIPPTGFLRYLDLVVTLTATGNAATVAFAANAPWNAISFLSLTNAAGDTIIVPVDGYMCFLMNKYFPLDADPPYTDPRLSRMYSVTSGVGSGAGGSAQFRLRIPLEIDPETAFGAIASMAGNKMLQVQLQVAPTSTIYTTAPTAAPSVSATIYQAFWAPGNPNNGRGVSQATVPDGNNSIQMWRLETPSVTPGDKTIQFHNVGNVLRGFLFVYQTATGARTDADIPAVHEFTLNNDPHYYLPDGIWKDDMAQLYGYQTATNDGPMGLDTGVRAFPYFMASDGHVRCSSVREQYLPTLDTTVLTYRGQSFGANMSTLQILTCEIKPTSAGALYQHT